MNSSDIVFMFVSTSFVMFMIIGLALFYGGLVRARNILSVIAQCMICIGLVTIIWILYGYSLVFGADVYGFIGNLDFVFLKNVGQDAGPHADNIPHILFCMFQLMFAAITPALITGAFAERMKFKAFILFTFLWSTFVYFPIAHWVWGGGWIGTHGGLDFAGGTVIHINSAVAALAGAIAVGKRKDWPGEQIKPHNLGITFLGAGILWLGWFGFNSGSALAANGVAMNAFFVTQIAASASALSWMAVEWKVHGKPTVLGLASGAVAGLVAITPASGFVSAFPALLIGLAAGILCFYAVGLKARFRYDDSLDVVAIHGVGGLWGALATGLFASTAVNPSGSDGLFYGNPSLFVIQLADNAAVIVYSMIVSLVIFKIVDLFTGLKVSPEEENAGLDISLHGEKAYN
jgi:Amt family ammonium transporter